jgi:wyosine [tRNA(Phe)-imidazoG37] synthetase (radical SAM superfamily)
MADYKYCYGPVGSWRLGISLGVDPISQAEKICDFDCVYCQLGHRAPRQPGRAVYLRPEDLGAELEAIKAPADYITFSGRGEPTMAANLNDLRLESARRRPEKTAVITNASMIYSEKVREDLAGFDFVLAKLDAPDMGLFREINRPADGISFGEILKGLILFSKGRRGRLAVQTMLISANKGQAKELARLYSEIRPDEVQLNTPLRPCAEKPLCRAEVEAAAAEVAAELARLGAGDIKVVTVYGQRAPAVKPVSAPDTLRRRGKV